MWPDLMPQHPVAILCSIVRLGVELAANLAGCLAPKCRAAWFASQFEIVPKQCPAKAQSRRGPVRREVAELLFSWIESADSWFFLCFSPLIVSVMCGSGRDEEPSGEKSSA